MIGSSKHNGENYPRKCFWTREKEIRLKFNPGLSANQPSNNWALVYTCNWQFLSVHSHSCEISWKNVACEQALHLGDIMWKVDARETRVRRREGGGRGRVSSALAASPLTPAFSRVAQIEELVRRWGKMWSTTSKTSPPISVHVLIAQLLNWKSRSQSKNTLASKASSPRSLLHGGARGNCSLPSPPPESLIRGYEYIKYNEH